MDKLVVAIVLLVIAVLAGTIYLVLTTPTCEDLGGRTVQNGWTLQPMFINNTLMMLPQPLFKCEGTK